MKERARTEKAMRETKEKWPKNIEELTDYINSLTNRPNDYGTTVYAMSLAAVATFNYMSHMLGASVFQAGCADLDFISRTRRMKHGFRILDYEKLLYPQYLEDDETFPSHEKILEDNKVTLAKLAKQKLAERCGVHPNVKARWEYIASLVENENEN